MKFRHIPAAYCLVLLIFFSSNKTNAQSIGIDFGISGTENFGEPNSTYGLSLIIPFSENFEGIFSFHRWSGEDDNYTLAKKINGSGTFLTGRFYGNKGFNLLINYKYLTLGDLSFLFGLGLSQFEMMELMDSQSETKTYYGAFTIVPLYLKYKFSERIGIYTRGTLSTEIGEFAPDWGTINIGFEIRPF